MESYKKVFSNVKNVVDEEIFIIGKVIFMIIFIDKYILLLL